MPILKSSQMIDSQFRQTDSCENWPSFSLFSSGAKILIFRKCRKLFAPFLHFRRKNGVPICHILVKTPKMRPLREVHFSQMFLPFKMYQQVKDRVANCLYNGVFYRSLLFNGRNTFYTYITFYAEWTYVYPILFFKSGLRILTILI